MEYGGIRKMERLYMIIATIKAKLAILGAWFKSNWVSVVLDFSVVILAALVGLLIGGFIGFIFVFNALLGF